VAIDAKIVNFIILEECGLVDASRPHEFTWRI
jgi:hypothetical protein